LNLRPSGYENPEEGLQAASGHTNPTESLDSLTDNSASPMQAEPGQHKEFWSAGGQRASGDSRARLPCRRPAYARSGGGSVPHPRVPAPQGLLRRTPWTPSRGQRAVADASGGGCLRKVLALETRRAGVVTHVSSARPSPWQFWPAGFSNLHNGLRWSQPFNFTRDRAASRASNFPWRTAETRISGSNSGPKRLAICRCHRAPSRRVHRDCLRTLRKRRAAAHSDLELYPVAPADLDAFHSRQRVATPRT